METNLEAGKRVANDIFAVFVKHEQGEISYDRALEDASRILIEYHENKSIVGYVKSGTLTKVLGEILHNKKVSEDESKKHYMYDVEIHQNEISIIERMMESLTGAKYGR